MSLNAFRNISDFNAKSARKSSKVGFFNFINGLEVSTNEIANALVNIEETLN